MSKWLMRFYLNSDTYQPLEDGFMSASIQNETQQKMLVTKVVLKFEWMKTRHWYEDCNIEIAPSAKTELPAVPFTIRLEAPTGTQQCKAGVVYKLLTDDGWALQGQGITYVRRGRHVMVTRALERDFEVFVSHSNSPEDILLLDKMTESFDRCGISTYVAERTPEPGYPLWAKIEAAIRRADAILVLFTEKGSQSGDIREEIGMAIGARKTKRVIPLVQEGLKTQGSLIGLEHVPLDIDKPLEALSIAISKTIEWADKKKQRKPKVTSISSTPSEPSV